MRVGTGEIKSRRTFDDRKYLSNDSITRRTKVAAKKESLTNLEDEGCPLDDY